MNQEDSEQNVVARTVVKAPKSPHITSILRSLHGLKINERIKYKLLSLTYMYKVLTTSQPDYTYTILSLFSLQVELAPRRLSPHPRLPHYKSPTTLSHMNHLTCGISSLLHSINLILFTVLLVHLILCISPHHSHQLRSHHLSLPLHFTPDLKLISL